MDGLRFDKMAKMFQKSQGFLASAPAEGCALPPQESMAAGVVVVGLDANGANFCMQHQKTAMVARSVPETVRYLFALEDQQARETLAANAYEFIKQYFPENEPTKFWQKVLNNSPFSSTDLIASVPDASLRSA